ncbi:hypothetical protein [Hyphomicrobium sp.]|uniref:hypothetical protein n=1 Tax=Hyphomicrobium sp. TaxID=82 RepID=UPI0025BEF358|nr:hypothetical protein [Hyphomicrobium sp.]MCC7253004.1 hypothetical protein [Hyphomicrobium sp.]
MSKVLPTSLKPAVFRAASVLPAVVAALALAMPSEAAAYSKKVENACRADYKTHCPAYKEGSSALRNCMSLAGRRGNLSKRCVNALTDAGLVPRKYRKR